VRVWTASKADTGFDRWNWLLCRRADFTAKIWPGNRQELYESGLTVDEAMLKTYPEWKPWGDSAERETP
jgi:hypothetical protein